MRDALHGFGGATEIDDGVDRSSTSSGRPAGPNFSPPTHDHTKSGAQLRLLIEPFGWGFVAPPLDFGPARGHRELGERYWKMEIPDEFQDTKDSRRELMMEMLPTLI